MAEVDEACATMDRAIERIAFLEARNTELQAANRGLLKRARAAEDGHKYALGKLEVANADVAAIRRDLASMGLLDYSNSLRAEKQAASSVAKADEPFGRQRQMVHVTFQGVAEDVDHYIRMVERYIDGQGDNVQRIGNQIKIHPRAVND